MKTYLVTYTATYEIPADSKEDAIDKASQANTRHADGTWLVTKIYKAVRGD